MAKVVAPRERKPGTILRELASAAWVAAALVRVPESDRMDVLATVCDAFIRTNGFKGMGRP